MHTDTGGGAPAVAEEMRTSTNPLQENGNLSLDMAKVLEVHLSTERKRMDGEGEESGLSRRAYQLVQDLTRPDI